MSRRRLLSLPSLTGWTARFALLLSISANTASVELISNYYLPWSDSASQETARIRSGDSEALRLQTRYVDYYNPEARADVSPGTFVVK